MESDKLVNGQILLKISKRWVISKKIFACSATFRIVKIRRGIQKFSGFKISGCLRMNQMAMRMLTIKNFRARLRREKLWKYYENNDNSEGTKKWGVRIWLVGGFAPRVVFAKKILSHPLAHVWWGWGQVSSLPLSEGRKRRKCDQI